jgi:hypothetical protein
MLTASAGMLFCAAGQVNRSYAAMDTAPMKRRLLIFVTAVSLVLCVATVALWVRSYWTAEGVCFTRVVPLARGESLCSSRGYLLLLHVDFPGDPKAVDDSPGWSYESSRPMPLRDYLVDLEPRGAHRFAGVTYFNYTWSAPTFDGQHQRALLVPHWLVAAVLAAWPLSRLLSFCRRRRAARRAPGLCRGCGYDLRASPDRCPECGTAPADAKAAA